MGKKLSPQLASLKVSKNKKKQQPNTNLIKILKPKVYIINSSSFKGLVQELTGNGSPISSPPLPTSPPIQETLAQETLTEETLVQETIFQENLAQDYSYQENGMEYSFDSLELISGGPTSSLSTFDYSLSQYAEVESWLLEMDPFEYNCDGYFPSTIQQEVFVGV